MCSSLPLSSVSLLVAMREEKREKEAENGERDDGVMVSQIEKGKQNDGHKKGSMALWLVFSVSASFLSFLSFSLFLFSGTHSFSFCPNLGIRIRQIQFISSLSPLFSHPFIHPSTCVFLYISTLFPLTHTHSLSTSLISLTLIQHNNRS